LTPLPIPLRDSNARVDLKAVIDRIYDEGSFTPDLYTRPPDPPLSPADAAWAAQFVPPPTPR
jgi:hypothetical protein